MDVLLHITAFFLAASAGPHVVVPDVRLDRVGNCVTGEGRLVGLRNLMFLENRSLDISSGDGSIRIILEGERVEIETLGPKPVRGIYSTNIGDEVDPNDDLDIELKLALLSERLLIYWKETYQNRIYRQGLFRVVNEKVESFCEGKGGLNSSQ